MMKGFRFLNIDESNKFVRSVNILEKHFNFLPRLIMPSVVSKDLLSDFNLSQHELFVLEGSPEGKLVLAPEYTNYFSKNCQNFENGYYIQPCFRKERPQKNRFRQFYQFGVEAKEVGNFSILLLDTLIKALEACELEFKLEFNNQGTREERELFFYEVLRKTEQVLCETCGERVHRATKSNLFRILECDCNELSEELSKRFTTTNVSLESWIQLETKADFSPNLFRGIDYYNGYTFNIVSAGVVIGGGGYYGDKFGFALGLDRMISLMKAVVVHTVYWLKDCSELSNFLASVPEGVKINLLLTKPPRFVTEPCIIVTNFSVYLISMGTRKRFNNLTDIWKEEH